jgi:hypothetical protein
MAEIAAGLGLIASVEGGWLSLSAWSSRSCTFSAGRCCICIGALESLIPQEHLMEAVDDELELTGFFC